MSMLDKFKKGAQKAGIQATALVKEGSSRVASGSRDFVQGFTLPGEAEKAAKIPREFPWCAYSFQRHRQHHLLNALLPQLTPIIPNLHSTQYLQPSSSVQEVTFIQSQLTPSHLLMRSGLAVFQVLKAGFMFSGKAGSGLVIARLPDGSWSAPSCIATGGLGWGLQIGADITDFVIVLNSEDAVKAFSIGGNATLAHPAPMFSYSKSKGLFAGLSLEGTVLIERKDANRDFYGSPVPARDILGGRVPPPEVASRLYEIIEAAEGLDETGVPQAAYVPSATGEHMNIGSNHMVFDAEAH
ncbi:DUF500-domain-containing protein [Suillus variegatus]|nr:DUF500-domain-containing protein [Suillus variegatus]